MTKTRDLADLGGGFIQTGTGAVQRTVESKLQDVVSVKDFGAVGNGVADDTSSIQNALNQVGSGGILYIPKGTYLVSSQLSNTVTGPLKVIAEPGTVFNATSSTDYAGLRLQGSLGTATNLSSNVTTGKTSISVGSVTGLAVGDWIVIQSTTNFVPEVTENLGSGEFARISGISGNTLSLSTGLSLDYLAVTTTVSKLNGFPIEIENLTIQRNLDNAVGFDIYRAHGVRLTNCSVTGAKERSIWIRTCVDVDIVNCKTTAAYTASYSTNYGVALDNAQHVRIDGGTYRAGRHGIKIGAAADKVTSSYIEIKNATVGNTLDPASATWALDCHDTADYVTVDSCTVSNGIGIQARNCVITNNKVVHGSETNAYNTMIYWWPYTSNGSAIIKNNYLVQTGSASVVGVRFNLGVSTITGLTANSVFIADNTFINVNTAIGVAAWDDSNSKLRNLVISGNMIVNPAAYAIRVHDSSNRTVRTIDTTAIETNNMQGKVEFYHAGVVTRFLSNTVNGLNTFNRVDFYCSGDVDVTQNSFTAFTSSNGLNIDSKYAEVVNVSSNIHKNNSGSVAVSFPRQKITSGWAFIGASASSSQVPQYGQWTVNDIIFDISPSAGSYIGWICSTAGYGIKGAWTTATSYSVGHQVTNGGKLYRAVTAGTSGATAPTHTSGEASDGSVTWEFITSVATTAVFNQFGAILP